MQLGLCDLHTAGVAKTGLFGQAVNLIKHAAIGKMGFLYAAPATKYREYLVSDLAAMAQCAYASLENQSSGMGN